MGCMVMEVANHVLREGGDLLGFDLIHEAVGQA